MKLFQKASQDFFLVGMGIIFTLHPLIPLLVLMGLSQCIRGVDWVIMKGLVLNEKNNISSFYLFDFRFFDLRAATE